MIKGGFVSMLAGVMRKRITKKYGIDFKIFGLKKKDDGMGKSLSMFNQNFEIFMERFPKLGLLVPRWPLTETSFEKISPIHLEKVDVLYFYGLGRGEIYPHVRNWLHENAERALILLEDDPGVIASFLHSSNAKEMLSDRQVHLELLSKGRERDQELNALAEKFPLKRVEVAALPSYRARRFQVLRLQLLRKTTLYHALYLDRLHGYQPFQNFVQNMRHLPESFYANALNKSFVGVPAIVCGAGPSLQKEMDVLRTLENRALMIAGGSTIAALSSQGVLPHFAMAVDPNLEEYRRLKNSFAFEVPLLYSTRVFPAIFQTCNGPFGYMRSGIGGMAELWIEEELGLLDPLLGENLSSESISVTAICIAWAQFLGCNPIILSGVDLAYTGKKRYAPGVGEDEEIPFAAIDAEKSAADRIIKRKDRKGNSVYTAVRWVMESSSISHFAKKHPEVRFINTTDGGIGFKDIDFMSLSEVVDQFLRQNYDLQGLVHQKISAASMPLHCRERIIEKMNELKESLTRLIGHLEILAGNRKGFCALAEMELKEEMAYPYLFYDIDQILEVGLSRYQGEKRSQEKWQRFLTLAQKYAAVINHNFCMGYRDL
jgi:hypothetical protein